MDQDDMKSMYTTADKFINLANELVKSDPSGNIGTALRFAAARYSAFQASTRTEALEEEKEKEFQLFSNEFSNMLKVNLEDYIKIQGQKV